MIALKLKLTLEEPVLATAPGGDPNANLSLPYIPGSMLRGALVGRYLENKLKTSESDEFAFWFLSGHIRFLNAYPRTETGQRTLPVPAALVNDKSSPMPRIVNRLKSPAPVTPKSIRQMFGWLEGNVLHTFEMEDEVTVHNARDREMGRAGSQEEGGEGSVFQYRALARNTVFEAVILVPEEPLSLAAEVKALCASGSLWLGGSATANYGRTYLEIINEENNWREVTGDLPPTITPGQTFTLVLLSDLLVRDDNGQHTDCVVKALNKLWGEGSVSPQTAYRRLGWVGGFNRKWGLPLPQEWAVLAGGSYLLKAERALTHSELETLEANGLGERVAEGFGRVAVNWNWPGECRVPETNQHQLKQEKAPPPSLQDLSEAEQKLAHKMTERLLRYQLDRAAAAAINRIVKTVKRQGIRNSQIARLRLRCREAVRQRTMEPLEQYLQKVESRAVVREQLQRTRVDNRTLLRWVEEWVKADDQAIWEKLGAVKDYQIGAPTQSRNWRGEAGLQREYTLRLVDGVLARLAKQTEDEE